MSYLDRLEIAQVPLTIDEYNEYIRGKNEARRRFDEWEAVQLATPRLAPVAERLGKTVVECLEMERQFRTQCAHWSHQVRLLLVRGEVWKVVCKGTEQLPVWTWTQLTGDLAGRTATQWDSNGGCPFTEGGDAR